MSLGRVRALLAAGVTDPGCIKRQTRLGMGRCQGRYCGTLLAEAIARMHGRPLDPWLLFAPQLPAKPVPAAALAVEKPEWGGHRMTEPPPFRDTLPPGEPLPAETDVLVIGGGILGTSTALFAAREGLEVVLIERGHPNGQASGGNAGSLHVQLLSFDFGPKAQAGGTPAALTLPLQRDAVVLWQELERTLGADFEIRITGGLMVAEDAAQMDFLRRKTNLERSLGIEVELLDARALRDLAPAVDERMVGAAWCPLEGKINPLVATPAVLQAARAAGAAVYPLTELRALERDASGTYTAVTNRGPIRARRVVNAAGAWSAGIARMLGVHLPVRGAPLQMIVTEPAPPLVGQLVAHADRHLTLKQAQSGNLIIGGGWSAGVDALTLRPHTLRESIEGNLWVAIRTVPAVSALHVIRSWAAMNVNIDGAPVIGEVPGLPGFYVAVTANGYTLGPLVGRITASLLKTGDPGRDITPFSIGRLA